MPLHLTWFAEDTAFAQRGDSRMPFESAAFRAAFFSVTEGLAAQRRLICLVGDPGSGKTTLLRSLQRALVTEGETVLYHDGCSNPDILSSLARQLSIYDYAKAGDHQSLLNALLTRAGDAVVLIDHVDELEARQLHELADLANAQQDRSGLKIVAALDSVCPDRAYPFADSDVERELVVPLGPLMPEEVVFYVQYQLAGTRHRHVRFARDALLKVFAYSGGSPGQINRIGAHALSAKVPVIRAADIDKAAVSCGLTGTSDTGRLTVAWFGGPQPAAAAPSANVRPRRRSGLLLFATISASSIGLLFFGLGLGPAVHDAHQAPEANRDQESRSDWSGAPSEGRLNQFYPKETAQPRSHGEGANMPLSTDELSEYAQAYSPPSALRALEAVGALPASGEFVSTAQIRETSPAMTAHPQSGAQDLDQPGLSIAPGEARETEVDGAPVKDESLPDSLLIHSVLPGTAGDGVRPMEPSHPASSSPHPPEPGITASALVSREVKADADHGKANERKSPEDTLARLAAPPEPARKQAPAADVQQLMRRGKELMQSGDIAAARLFFQRAAAAGHPEAYTAMGQTYDPIELRRRNVIGIKGDKDTAMKWYREGEQAGDRNARERLAQLSAFMNQWR